jgi:Hus1-like protein
MMHAEEVEFYKAPDVPTPQVQLEMPNQKSVRTVVDRMKSKQCKDHCFLPFCSDYSAQHRHCILRLNMNGKASLLRSYSVGLTQQRNCLCYLLLMVVPANARAYVGTFSLLVCVYVCASVYRALCMQV